MEQPRRAPEPRLGDPLGNPPPAPVADREPEPAAAPPSTAAGPRAARPGDSGLGQPDFAPEWARALTPEESAEFRARQEEELRRQFEARLEELSEGGARWMLPPAVRQALSWLSVGVAAVLGLFLIGQASSIAATIAALPPPFHWIAGGGALLFGGVLVFVIARLLWMVVRLNRAPAVQFQALEVLRERERWRRLAAEHAGEARAVLMRYLSDFPMAAVDRRRMLAMGMKPEEHEALRAARERLLDEKALTTPADWLRDFASQFQSVLDAVAQRRVRAYALRAGIGTATSPVAFVDQMIVLFACTAMIRDLLQLYHLRPRLGQTAVLLARSIMMTYLSGMLEELAESATESLSDSIADAMGDTATIFGSGIGRAISAKSTEAALNAYLIHRLGRRTVLLLQPVRRDLKSGNR